MKNIMTFLPLALTLLLACQPSTESSAEVTPTDTIAIADTIVAEPQPELTADQIVIDRELTFDKYTLEDSYEYKEKTRTIQWDKIQAQLLRIEQLQAEPQQWGVLQNYKNANGEAPLTKAWSRDSYKLVSDSLGVERYQSVPLYAPTDTLTPELYGRDGTLIAMTDTLGSKFWQGRVESPEAEWYVPRRYVQLLKPDVTFSHVVVVDRKNQHIVVLERQSPAHYLVRSINPATTGRHKPPHAKETPLGIFLLQQKKPKMFYTSDGSSRIAGFAPWASRFTCGAYIHGVPINNPKGKIVEYSPSLGTTPRSHMCVRNASSHAKFVYDNCPTLATLIVVIE